MKEKLKILYKAYKFYLHFFALYIKKYEISADEWNAHKRFESEILKMDIGEE